MFALGPTTAIWAKVERPLHERMFSAAAAAMAYWFYRWVWGEAVIFDALDTIADVTGMKLFSEFVDLTVDAWLATPRRGPPSRMGPARCVLSRFERYGHDVHLAFAREIGGHLLSLKRHPAGPVILDAERTMAFVDSHYGDPLFMLELSRITGDTTYAARGMEILLHHSRVLQDEKTGLYSHFCDLSSGNPRSPGIFWGRGQGWAAMGISDALGGIERSGYDDRSVIAEITERFAAFCRGLGAYEVAGGGWRNIIDEPASYPESSTTAMIVAGLTSALNRGLISEGNRAMVDRGWAMIAHRIDVHGHLIGVSSRPGINTNASQYEHAPAVLGAFPWAQGPYLLAAIQRYQKGER